MTQAQALEVLKTGANVFLTGEPGAGKTHTINEYTHYLRSCGIEVAVTASTGIAATHLSGMTIHSWSGIGIKSKLTRYDIDRLASNEYLAKRVARAKVLIIDEISMLGPETLSMVDSVCREIRGSLEPFGGVQIVFVGDFFQLPPVSSAAPSPSRSSVSPDDELSQDVLFEEAFGEDVPPPPRFAYASPAWQKSNPITCYLTEQHRQDDADFLELLSAIRRNEFGESHLSHIEKRTVLEGKVPTGIPKLYSHNANVDVVNDATLRKIMSGERVFEMKGKGKEFLIAALKKGCLSPERLVLKVGAEIMFTKNKPKSGFFNGTLGVVEAFSNLSGNPIVKTKSGQKIEVEMMEWSVEENGKVKASIAQLPLRLAWAITVHKSQGMSMDAAIVDLRNVFEYGQGYVALSRVRRLAGIHVLGWNELAFRVHPEVLEQDEIFRANSEEAEGEFAKLDSKELTKLHDNFIAATGGHKSVAKTSKKRSTATTSGSTFAKIREKHGNAFRRWDDEQEKELIGLFKKKVKMREIAKKMGRRIGGIRARLEKLELIAPRVR